MHIGITVVFVLCLAATCLCALPTRGHTCPGIECLDDIPRPCRMENYVDEQDGTRCRACDTRMPNCTGQQPRQPSIRSRKVNECTQTECPGPYIPRSCRQNNYLPRPDRTQCRECDSRKPNCSSTYRQKVADCPRSEPCPTLDIHYKCKQRNYGTNNGARCRLCNTEKAGCKYTGGRDHPRREMTPKCPTLVPCEVLNVSKRCRQRNYGTNNGSRCRLCDTKKPGCTSGGHGERDHREREVTPKCPTLVPCEVLNIYERCKQRNYGTDNGSRCRLCDTKNPGCTSSGLGERYHREREVTPKCPTLVPCEVLNISERCKQRNYGTDNGSGCRLCDTKKPGCTSGGHGERDHRAREVTPKCPTQVPCEVLNISERCKQRNYGTDNGSRCRLCDTKKRGCTSGGHGERDHREREVTPKCPTLLPCEVLNISERCKQRNYGADNGSQCRLCDTKKPGCTSSGHGERDHREREVTPKCPTQVPCEVLNISEICKQRNYGTDNGSRCRMCDTKKPGCTSSGHGERDHREREVTPKCPTQVPCEVLNISERCKQRNYGTDNGFGCRLCDTKKPGCGEGTHK